MIRPLHYDDAIESVEAADLEGLLAHWDFAPLPGTLLAMLRGSSIAIVARAPNSTRVCGYVTALTDHLVCGYISAIEVRAEYRNQGVGTELLERIIGRLDVYGTYLSCAPAMVPFYEAADFTPVTGMARRRSPAAAP